MEIPYEVAELKKEQVEKIQALERELNKILIAYDPENENKNEVN